MKFKLLFVSFLVLASGCRFIENKVKNIVPDDWFMLPENGVSTNGGSLTEMSRIVDGVLGAQGSALEKMDSEKPDDPSSFNGQYPKDWVPWHLAYVMTNFAVTGEGVLGSKLLGGTAAVKIIWEKSNSHEAVAGHEQTQNLTKRKELKVSSNTPSEKILNQLEPTVQAALVQGKIKNELNFRHNLVGVVNKFKTVAGHLEALHVEGSKFVPQSFKLEVAFGADGEVSGGIGVGGEVELRFLWERQKDYCENEGFPSDDQMGSNLESFVRAITPDLEYAALEAQTLEESGFELEAIKIGLGMSAEYEFGIAASSASIMGVVKFVKKAELESQNVKLNFLNPVLPESQDDLQLIYFKPKLEHRIFASTMGIKTKESMFDSEESVVYSIKHSAFRSGLVRAVHMAGFFVKHASQINHSSWRICEVETEFSMSLTGSLGLATIGGEGEVELEFERESE